MSKINDLMLIFDKAYCDNLENPETLISSDSAGVIAVVKALRDEIDIAIEAAGAWAERDAEEWFNEILGDAGNEKAAGGPTREDGTAVEAVGDKGPVTVNSPAAPTTDYTGGMNDLNVSPETCEWTTTSIDAMGYGWMAKGCGGEEHERNLMKQVVQPFICPSCGKPIRFKEKS